MNNSFEEDPKYDEQIIKYAFQIGCGWYALFVCSNVLFSEDGSVWKSFSWALFFYVIYYLTFNLINYLQNLGPPLVLNLNDNELRVECKKKVVQILQWQDCLGIKVYTEKIKGEEKISLIVFNKKKGALELVAKYDLDSVINILRSSETLNSLIIGGPVRKNFFVRVRLERDIGFILSFLGGVILALL